MKQTLALILTLVLALQSLIAAADMHHGVESLVGAEVHHHVPGALVDDTHQHSKSSGKSDVSHHPSCHSHLCFSLHLACHAQPLVFSVADPVWLPAVSEGFSSWIAAPLFRPPIA